MEKQHTQIHLMCAHTHTHAHMHTHTHVRTHARTHPPPHTHTHTHTHSHTQCTRTTLVHAHSMHTHTHIHTLPTHHFLNHDLHKILNSFFGVFFSWLLNNCRLQHLEHFLARNVPIAVQIIDVKTVCCERCVRELRGRGGEGECVNVGVWEGKCLGEEYIIWPTIRSMLTDTHTLSFLQWSPAETQTTLQPIPSR